ncbi:MAG: succinate dehydrogenase flavoprotein subunit [Thermogemmatispora sp.]|jgi:succinate dehydrogenase / fumarate reductase flavoprotein subunit|uniref:Succinate dehydrogenase flavoprotein subunit n=1 Tax=Thermogemmatispora aurantia TaxID=2045279 RepID=A0A5J4KDK8_9CHLR|nr:MULTISPECIES: succinate dehydrogenase flavoprotein subunit [Thermogemmatispora]MBE3565682.1 succinate dehydrogenase flavoprotein subunit [Thermogemmatispora sp.]GER85603.1 succinate dehydrogenase flavoprotein subunit [Thermogemmatispora aurantia]
MYQKFDVVIVGAGGAGLMAAMQLPNASVAVLSKVYPTRSHTGAAQGGVAAALGNLEEDHWKWHMYDTVKGGDYLVDQPAAEILARDAIDAIYELEHRGLPFNRTPDGRIDQRRFGGHTRNYGEAPVRRSCYAADRTGHMLLQTMYQNAIKNQVRFFNEFLALDLLINEGRVCGVVALEIRTGEIHTFHAKAVLFATGGYGRAWRVTSNAFACMGDGMAIAYRRGIPLEDMEMYQFHPTGLYKVGVLLSEGARGEGARLLNGKGEYFMERYMPTLKDLAPRDIVSRCIIKEIKEGRGVNGEDYVYLDLRHLGEKVITEKLPDITEFARNYLGVEPIREPVPIQPTAHYAMGGIPTDNDGRVVIDSKWTPLPGFYAAGEVACVSVHGANRLGTNSLVDLIVFGRRAGKHMARFIAENDHVPLPPHHEDFAREMVDHLLTSKGGESAARIRNELQGEMLENVFVERQEKGLQHAMDTIAGLQEAYKKVQLQDKGKTFNTELVEAIELGFLLDCAAATVHGALARKESRGAHYRLDYPERDDVNWLKHTLIYKGDGTCEARLDYKDVILIDDPIFKPKERKY